MSVLLGLGRSPLLSLLSGVGHSIVLVLDLSSVLNFCDGSLVLNICLFSSFDPSLLSFGLGSEAV